MDRPELSQSIRVVGRYVLYGAIASGGMASVHFGRLLAMGGFSRTVAIKRLHAHLAAEPEFVSMFLDEARLAARIRHPNVVPTLDVVALEGELFLVMEYIHGESLSRVISALSRDRKRIPLPIAAAIATAALNGLHAAHEAKSERGVPLNIVHRDVSPQNILIGSDGLVRVLDFGVAKATDRLQTTREGQIKGKLSYMAPEQVLANQSISRRTDVYAAGVVLWEMLVGRRLFPADDTAPPLSRFIEDTAIEPPSRFVPDLPKELDAIVLRALSRSPDSRFPTAREMAGAIEACVPPASTGKIAEWLEEVAGEVLRERARSVSEIESSDVPDVLANRAPSGPPSAPPRDSQETLRMPAESSQPDAVLAPAASSPTNVATPAAVVEGSITATASQLAAETRPRSASRWRSVAITGAVLAAAAGLFAAGRTNGLRAPVDAAPSSPGSIARIETAVTNTPLPAPPPASSAPGIASAAPSAPMVAGSTEAPSAVGSVSPPPGPRSATNTAMSARPTTRPRKGAPRSTTSSSSPETVDDSVLLKRK